MKQSHGWWFPDHEVHLIDWMNSKKNRVVMNGRCAYQGNKQLAALKHCRQFRVAIDVGAHIGLWSFNLAHAFQETHAFEPVAAHRECFEKNVTWKEVHKDHIHLHQAALGDHHGWASMVSEDGSSGNTTIGPGADVAVQTLDGYEIQNVDLIKIDCEGFEENVLRGGEQTIRTWKPTIVVEQKREMAARFGLQPLGAVRLLESWGYKQTEEISGDHFMVPA